MYGIRSGFKIDPTELTVSNKPTKWTGKSSLLDESRSRFAMMNWNSGLVHQVKTYPPNIFSGARMFYEQLNPVLTVSGPT